ncbi:2Fe-2S iron-sulfur cluster-binding protein [Nocardioides sp. NPDC058538]|uniref:2Fe-2S iron-sulfur cluster-binding protein n=1 Tax=Nocardioides sp. NPDC058538 TaxID=3346542 RepID=UPI003655DDED
MTHTISVADTDISFTAEEGQSILDAAETAGWAIPYSCRKGVCATCEGTLNAGKLDTPNQGVVCGPADKVQFCRAKPTGDVEIAPRRIQESTPPVRKKLTTAVFKIKPATDEITILDLRYPIGRRTPFKAGQFVNIILPDGDTRPYSMANSPQHNDALQLHIRHEPGGAFSDKILSYLQFHDEVEIEAPFGEFHVADGDSPIILLATGTGFAPMRSIILDHIARRLNRPIHLYWGGRTAADLYDADMVRALTQRYEWLTFTPVVSRPDSTWTGATGWVQDALLADYPDLDQHDVYACGSEAMTIAVVNALITERSFNPERFHADAFVSSGAANAS